MDNKNVIQKVVLGGVVIKDNKILIVQRNMDEDIFPGLWELPSGKKEDLETAEASLVREVKEETGLDVLPVAPFDVFNYQIEKPDVIKDSTQINYLVKPANNQDELVVVLSSEHQDYKWVGADEMDSYNLSDSTKSVLKKAFKVAPIITSL